MDFFSPEVDATRERLTARFGALVAPWWERLPQVLLDLAGRWDLVIGDQVGRGNTSILVRCLRADGSAALLKLGPDPTVGIAESWALRAWAPSGRVPLVWGHDAVLGALLLEALPNEASLADTRASATSTEIASLIAVLHSGEVPTAEYNVVSLAERIDFVFEHWIQRHPRLGGTDGRSVPVSRLRRGRNLALDLATDSCVPVLLHGDLHPGNVIDAGAARGLVAIDPRPCVGDAAFDAVDWVFWGRSDPRYWQPAADKLALELGLDRKRIWAWCTTLASVLAAARAAQGADSDEVDALLALAP